MDSKSRTDEMAQSHETWPPTHPFRYPPFHPTLSTQRCRPHVPPRRTEAILERVSVGGNHFLAALVVGVRQDHD